MEKRGGGVAKLKTSTFLLSFGLVLAVLAAANFALGRNSERAKRVWLEGELQKATSARDALAQERDELLKTKETLESQLADSSAQAKKLAEEIAAEKRAREAVTTELAQARQEATDQADRLEDEKQSLTEDLAKAKQSYQALSNELTTLRQAKEALERRVKEMLALQAQEAEKIVVTPPPGVVAAPRPAARELEGKILVVNREFNFIVVNLGSKDGAAIGNSVAVLRSGKVIAKAQVEKLYESMAAATLLTEETKERVKEGDLIRVTP